jgi:hypothetical protein
MTMPEYPFDDLVPGRPEAERARMTDEAVSADLDGELEAFATDLGLPVGDIRHRLEVWPGFDARRAALEAARTSIRSGAAPALDEITRRRLLAGARPPESSDTTIPAMPVRSRNRWVALSAAAAVLLVFGVGAAVLLRGNGGGTSRTATDAPAVAAVGYVGDLGDVTDPNTLRVAVADRLAAAKQTAAGATTNPANTTTALAPPQADGSAAATPELARGQTITSAPAPADSANGTTKRAPAADARDQADRCATTIVQKAAPGRDVVLTGTGVYHGQPAVVVTIRRGQRTVTFVADLATCAVVGGQASGSG